MASQFLPGYMVLDRLRKALGIEQDVTRIVIDAQYDSVVMVYVQMPADRDALGRAEDALLGGGLDFIKVERVKEIAIDRDGNVSVQK